MNDIDKQKEKDQANPYQGHFVLPDGVRAELVAYLRKQPYEDVSNMIAVLAQLPQIKVRSS